MPAELEFVLRLDGELRLPLFTGYISRGILLNLIRQADPASSQSLHEPNITKPYSVTPLCFKSQRRTAAGYLLDPSSPCSFRIRFMSDRHVMELLSVFEKKSSIMVRDRPLRIESVRVRSESYEDMLESAFPAERLHLEFLTPTRFSALGRGREYLFPDQKKVFGGLLELWNLFSGHPLADGDSEEYLDWLGSSSWVSCYSLRTELKDTSKGKIVGFTGRVTYNFEGSERWRRLTCCLASLAEFSNVGKGRTAGFGVVRASASQKEPAQRSQ